MNAERDGLILYRLSWAEHGVVVQIKAGSKVNPRQRLIEIPDMTTLQVQTIVFESKNRLVQIRDEENGLEGSAAVISLDALPNREFKGRVVRRSTLPKINGQPWMETGARVYELFLEVDWKAAGLTVGQQLKPGMKCNVEVILDEVDDALQIPITSVYSGGGRYFCRKIADQKPVEQEITIGKMSERHVQVLSGLEEGDEVLVSAGAAAISGSVPISIDGEG